MLQASLLLSALLLSQTPPPADGEALIRAMHDRYAGKWYQTASFVQKTTFPQTGKVETWYEAMTVPGRLRIDIAPIDSGNAIVFRNDSVYRFRQGRLTTSRPFVHPLMVLGFDVYGIPVEETVKKLSDLGFDLAKLHENTWQGRAAYIVGAEPSDLKSLQFWVDKERLYFVRLIEPAPQSPSAIAETQFNNYQKLRKGWMAVEVVFTVDGKPSQIEEYSDVRGDVALGRDLFEVDQYRRPAWVGK